MARAPKKSAAVKAVELAVSKLNAEIQKLTDRASTIGDEIDALKAQRDQILESLPRESENLTEEAAQ